MSDDVTTYRPSPRPSFDAPTAIPYASVTRHVWGDAEAGQVADWIYASTERIHALVFGLPAGGAFLHSREFRTVFGADELLHVLEGTMVLANPETGEVVRVPRGGNVFFRRDTWHHAFAHGPEPLRVIELFAPPPATGTSGAYARTRPYLELADSRYADDGLIGRFLPGERPANRTLRVVSDADVLWRRDLGALVGILASTEHLTAALLDLGPGDVAAAHAHAGDEVLYVLEGVVHVRAWHDGETHVFELGPRDACYLPTGCRHEYRAFTGPAQALMGVAPSYLAP
jgi:quercetin dioxygenase-like cupin family protein